MSTPNPGQWSARDAGDALRVALMAAEEAAALIRERAGDAATLDWQEKSAADFVSEVDLAAEQAIREVVAREAPGAVVMAEEGSPDVTPGAITFVVDPLDGTTNFLHGYPAYAVSIGVALDGAMAAAVVRNVPSGKTYTARAGGGARRDGTPIAVSRITTPSRALIGTGFPFKHLDRLPAYQRQFAQVMGATSGIRRAGSAALDLCDVACGRFDAFWELALMPWDFAAGTLLVREAGGVITDLAGAEPPLAPSGIVAGNPHMHRWLLDLVTPGEA